MIGQGFSDYDNQQAQKKKKKTNKKTKTYLQTYSISKKKKSVNNKLNMDELHFILESSRPSVYACFFYWNHCRVVYNNTWDVFDTDRLPNYRFGYCNTLLINN